MNSLLREIQSFGDIADFEERQGSKSVYLLVTFRTEDAAWDCLSKLLFVDGVPMKLDHAPVWPVVSADFGLIYSIEKGTDIKLRVRRHPRASEA